MNQEKNQPSNSVEKAYEDCYYFLYSNCKRGDTCIYRHCLEAKTSTKLCPEWEKTKKCSLNCPFRHSYYHLQKKRSNDMCYFEETPQGCTKPYCEYKHKDTSRDIWKNEIESPNMPEKNERSINTNMDNDMNDKVLYQIYNQPLDYSNSLESNKPNYELSNLSYTPEVEHSKVNKPFAISKVKTPSQGFIKPIHGEESLNNKATERDFTVDSYNTTSSSTIETGTFQNKKMAFSNKKKSSPPSNFVDDSSYFENLRNENTSLLNAIEDIEREISDVDNFLLKLNK